MAEPRGRALRHSLAELVGERLPNHAGLAHEVYAPRDRPGGDAGGDQGPWDRWFSHFEAMPRPAGYHAAYKRWKASCDADPRTLPLVLVVKNRLLVGHGNPSPTGVGLTLDRTWGTPVIPGSALKGLTSSYAEVTYGPAPEDMEAPERAPYRGIRRDGGRVVQGPGEVLRRLFGAPELDGGLGDEPGAIRGEILFHDAWWIPDTPDSGRLPLARDVLTVHQSAYYGQRGGGKTDWPNDHDEPRPISFLTVRPGARFLAALTWAPAGDTPETAAPEVLARASLHLTDALREWGVGGKTAAGYGRLEIETKNGKKPR